MGILKDKAAESREYNPNWREVTTGPFAKKYRKVMKTKIVTLEYMGAWDIVYWDKDINVIKSTWSFKCKRYTYSLINKFKDHFCASGYQQLEGIDFFETYALVVK